MINSIAELKEEKHRIRKRRRELETEIGENWDHFKEGLRPVNLVKDAINGFFNHKAEETRNTNDSVLKSTLSLIATELASTLSDKATSLYHRIFKKKPNDRETAKDAASGD